MRIRRTPGSAVQPRRRSRSRSWPAPVGLLVLSAVPLLAGTFRLVQLVGGPALIPADQRFDSSPVPVALHIVAATVFALLGILQLVPRFRRRHLVWHRRAGRGVAVAGLVVAGTAFWMALFYAQKQGTGPLLLGLRLVFAPVLAACLVLGVTTVRRGDIAGHRAWMIRAYAIALAAGTQAFTGGFAPLLPGSGVLKGDIAMGSAWPINLAIAEWVIRRGAGSTRRASTSPQIDADLRAAPAVTSS
jgi:uncharacterized membrane protein